MARPGFLDVDRRDGFARSQDAMSRITADAGSDIDMQMVQDIGERAANAFLLQPDTMADSMATYMQKLAETGDLTQIEAMRHALQIIEQRQPGLAKQLVANAGAPELFAADFGAVAADPAGRVPRTFDSNVPHLEQLGTYGQGLGQLLKFEDRSARKRAESIDPATALPWQMRTLLQATSPEAYKAVRLQQIQALIAQGVPEDVARSMTASQRDAAVGPGTLENLGDQFSQMAVGMDQSQAGMTAGVRDKAGMSQRDQVVAGMLTHAQNGTNPPLDGWFKGWRYQYPIIQGGEIVRPQTAPTGNFLARLSRGQLQAYEVPDWVARMTPVFDRAIQEQAATNPQLRNKYGKTDTRTAADFAQMLLPISRNGMSRLKDADVNGWPFQVYSDLPINRGPKPEMNIGTIDEVGSPVGGLLDDPQSISTPESAPVPEQQQILPADGDMSMYMPRRGAVPPDVLAALLA